MVGRAGHGARECWPCRAGQAQGCRISRVTIFEIDAEVRAVLSEIGNEYIVKRCGFFIHRALMHVRWQHRTAYLRNKDQAHWAATLVENVRIGDKMTERYVAYLAGIGERDITRLGAQCGFWERVTRQLDRLSNRISAEDRKRVERVLQERVPCPTRLQYDQWHSEGTRLLGSDRVTPPVENWPR